MLLEVAIGRMYTVVIKGVHCGHKGMDMVSKSILRKADII